MKVAFRKLMALVLTLAMVCTLMPAVLADGPDGPAPAPDGLTILEGSNGTLVASAEALASITLENPTDSDIVLHLVSLGESSQVTIAAGETYTVSAPAVYDENGDAYKLCLTGTDGMTTAEYPVTAGSRLNGGLEYTVSIVRGVLDYYVSHGQETARWITCFVYADENGVDPERSVLAGVNGTVEAGDTELSDISIRSYNDNTSALRAGGTGTLTVTGADIQLYGDGGDDFTGIGAALGVADTATLTVKDSKVYTEGILRSAIFAGDEGIMNLEAVTVDCEPGEYQADVSIPSAGMASPPNGLGIWGNCRAMNMVDAATVNITNSEIISQDWGALGVDDVTDGHLTVKDSTIVIKDQGYGAYAIGKCVDVFENCTFDIEYGVVGFAAAGDGSEMILSSGSQADSRNYYGFVTHQSFNGTNSKITVTGEGTALNTKLGGIIAKGRGADVEISDGATVSSENGVLVRAQINDDTGAGTMDGTEVVNVTISGTVLQGDIIQGMGKEYEAADSAAAGDAAAPAMEGNPAEMGMANPAEMGEMPMGEMGAMGPMGPGGPGGPGGMGGSAKTESTMNVTLSQAELEGTISSATLDLVIEDGNISFDNILDVGIVEGTTLEYNPYAKLNVALENEAHWIVTEPSYLMSLTIDDTSTLEALPGYKVILTVDGTETPVEPGEYAGEIKIDVLVDESYVPEEEVPSAVEEAPVSEEPVQQEQPQAEPETESEPQTDETAETSGPSVGGIIGIVAAVLVILAVVILVVKKKK